MKSSLNPDASELIGKRLQKYYGASYSQTLPEQFKVLLAQLDKITSNLQTQSEKPRM